MGAFSQGPMNSSSRQATVVMPQKINEFFVDQQIRQQFITGVTRDSAGAPLGACTVEVYETMTANNPNEPKGRFVGSVVSNADGTYCLSVYAGPGAIFRTVAYLPGSPDVAGTTRNDLVGV